MIDHLSRLELLRYVDGELSRSEMATAAAHIQSCWTCRSALEHLKNDICEIFEANERIFVPELSSPPKPWPGLEASFTRIEEAETMSLRRRFAALVAAPWRFPVRFATMATAVLLIVALFVLQVRPLSAEEVMQQVAAAETNRLRVSPSDVVCQKVRISKRTRTSPATVNASMDGWQSGTATYWESEQAPIAAELLERYKAAGITTALPLSSAALEGWIGRIGTKPTVSRGPGGIVTLQAEGENGAAGIREVSFSVQSREWRVQEVHLAFTDVTYDIAEDDFSVLDKRQVPDTVLASLGMPALHASAKASAPKAANPDDVEMGVRYTLHRIGADLGESIQVSRPESGEILVNAWGITSGRRAQLSALLGDRPGVRLDLQPPQAEMGRRELTVLSQTQPAEIGDQRLIGYFGSVQEEGDYTRKVLNESTAILSHLYALNALAERWPVKPASMSPKSRTELATMVSDHARQLRSQLDELSTQLNPLLARFGQTIPPTGGAQSGIPWQQSSHSGLEDGRRLDHTLRSLLTTSDDPVSADVALPRLLEQLQTLDRTANELLASSRQ